MVNFAKGQAPTHRERRRSYVPSESGKGAWFVQKDVGHTLTSKRWTLAVFAIICVPMGRIIIVRKRETGQWTLPGGRVKRNESISSALIREVMEETGLDIVQGPVLGVLERADQRQLCLYFRCHPRSGPVCTPKGGSSEITDWLAAKENNLPAPLAPQAAQILNRIRCAGEAAIWVPNFKHSEPLTAPHSVSNNTRRLLAKTHSIKKDTKLCTKKS